MVEGHLVAGHPRVGERPQERDDRRGSEPGYTDSWVGAVRADDGTLTLSAVVRVWIEVLARRRGCPGVPVRTWPSRRWPGRRRSAAWRPGTGSVASSSTGRRTRPARH